MDTWLLWKSIPTCLQSQNWKDLVILCFGKMLFCFIFSTSVPENWFWRWKKNCFKSKKKKKQDIKVLLKRVHQIAYPFKHQSSCVKGCSFFFFLFFFNQLLTWTADTSLGYYDLFESNNYLNKNHRATFYSLFDVLLKAASLFIVM